MTVTDKDTAPGGTQSEPSTPNSAQATGAHTHSQITQQNKEYTTEYYHSREHFFLGNTKDLSSICDFRSEEITVKKIHLDIDHEARVGLLTEAQSA